jgi:hypothetical protein
VNYLDMADAYWRADWKTAINGVWSPGYSWILAVVLHIVRPSPFAEFTLVHMVGLAAYLVALLCFELCLGQLIVWQEQQASVRRLMPAPRWVWMLFGYSLFLYSSLDLINLVWVNPDMCVAATVYLATALLIRVRLGSDRWATFLSLGLALGVGFLLKTVMLPMGFVFVTLCLLAAPSPRQAWPKIVGTVLVFLVIAAPFVVVLSKSKGRLTLGDSGKLNYVWHVGHVQNWHWRGVPAGDGIALHPTTRLLTSPEVYLFAEPPVVTYPLWYDPSIWYEGVEAHLRFREQVRALGGNLKVLANALLGLNGAALIGIVMLFSMDGRGLRVWREVSYAWPVLVPPAVAFAAYALVHTEKRYIAPYVVLLFVGLFVVAGLHDSAEKRRVGAVTAVLALLFLMSPEGPTATRKYYSAIKEFGHKGESTRHLAWQVAAGLRALGVESGEGVATTSHYAEDLSWARLARVRVIAEVYYRPNWPETLRNNYWTVDADARTRVNEALAKAGVHFLVTSDAPQSAPLDGWVPIDGTTYYVRPLGEARLRR